MEEKSLIVVEKLDPVALYTEGGMTVILTEIEAKVNSFVPDIFTEKGRKDIASFAHKIARSKTLLDNVGKAMVSEWKTKAKEVDAVRKEARDFCDNLKAGVRKPLDKWEAEEKIRREEEEKKEREKIQSRVDAFAQYGKMVPYLDAAALSEENYKANLKNIRQELEAEQARIAEEARLEKEKLAREAAARIAEDERLEKIRQEQAVAQEKIDEANRKIQEEKDKFEAEKNRIKEEEEKAAYEKRVKEEAEEAAKKKAELKQQEQDARERAEEEEKARLAELAPDREKLTAFLQGIMDVSRKAPSLKDEKAQFICNAFVDMVQGAVTKTENSMEEL